MKRYFSTLIMALALVSSGATHAFAWEYPAINAFGAVQPLPNAAIQPDSSLKYRIIFDVTKAAEAGKLNPGIEHAAKYLNIMASAGVAPKDMQVIVVVHGPASPLVLNDDAFREKFKRDNPDREIIQKLNDAGVKFYICGQTLAERGIDHKLVNDKIKVALSAMSTITTHQLRGYAYLPF